MEALDGASKKSVSAKEVAAATKEVLQWLAKLHTKGKFKSLCMTLMSAGEYLRHCSQQLCEWVSAAGDPVDFLQKVGAKADQPHPDLLKRAAKQKGEKLALQGMAEWLSAAVGGRTTPSKPAATKGKKVKFDTFSDSGDDAAEDPDKNSDKDSNDDTDKESEAPKVPKKQRKRKAASDEDSDADQAAAAEPSPSASKKQKRKAAATTAAAVDADAEVAAPKKKKKKQAAAAEDDE